MQHARVAVYSLTPGMADEVIRKGEAGMLPIFRAQPGYVSYGIMKVGEDTGVSISIWESREQADAATQTAAAWVRDNLVGLATLTQLYVGDLAYYVTAESVST